MALSLNLKQQKFAEHYAKSGNASESARLAGYKQPMQQGERLLRNVEIQDYLKNLTKADTDARIMDAVERQRLLTSIARNEEEKTSDRLKAIDQLSKIQADYSDGANVQINNIAMPTVIRIVGARTIE